MYIVTIDLHSKIVVDLPQQVQLHLFGLGLKWASGTKKVHHIPSQSYIIIRLGNWPGGKRRLDRFRWTRHELWERLDYIRHIYIRGEDLITGRHDLLIKNIEK